MWQELLKAKVRFQTKIGQITLEDLYDLPLISDTGKPDLNSIAQALSTESKTFTEENFVNCKPSGVKEELARKKLEAVKAIIADKQAALQEAADKKAKADQKRLILELISQKEGESLKAKSIDELKAILERE